MHFKTEEHFTELKIKFPENSIVVINYIWLEFKEEKTRSVNVIKYVFIIVSVLVCVFKFNFCWNAKQLSKAHSLININKTINIYFALLNRVIFLKRKKCLCFNTSSYRCFLFFFFRCECVRMCCAVVLNWNEILMILWLLLLNERFEKKKKEEVEITCGSLRFDTIFIIILFSVA